MAKRFIAILSAIALMLGVTTPALADAWAPTGVGSPDGSMVVAINEDSDYPAVSIRNMFDRSGWREFALCPNGVEESGLCSGVGGTIGFNASQILPACANDNQENCIESLKYGTQTGELSAAKFVRQTYGQTFEAVEKAKGLYAASTASLWDAPGLNHAGGTSEYAVIVKAEIGYVGDNTYYTRAMQANIVPIVQRQGDYRATQLRQGQDALGQGNIQGWGAKAGCAYTEAGYCGAIQNFALDSKFELSIRMSNQITGWFHGRIQAPTVKIEKFSENNNRIVMSASPVRVPRISTLITKETTSAKGMELLKVSSRTGSAEYFKGETIRSVSPSFYGLEWVEAFRENAKDTAAGESTLWNFATMVGGAENNSCFSDKSRVIGVVTTNATAMSEGTPDFTNGLLTYKVAGLHFAPDGKALNEGSYDLVMRSDVARCLYRFTSAPLSATISVIGDGGENKVATTVVSEKDGWLKMAAYGFTFSSPTISVKLTQAKAKKTTITCVKGKITKKVTAIGPKCPAGYKQK